ncbi:MAG: hypothetical protein AB7T38_13595 [Nitrospirales bacterium]
MATPYREILEHIRLGFPQPVSDRVHDSYFVHSIMRAVDAVDTLKSERPILGERKDLDYAPALKSHLPEQGSTVEAVTQALRKSRRSIPIPSPRIIDRMANAFTRLLSLIVGLLNGKGWGGIIRRLGRGRHVIIGVPTHGFRR